MSRQHGDSKQDGAYILGARDMEQFVRSVGSPRHMQIIPVINLWIDI